MSNAVTIGARGEVAGGRLDDWRRRRWAVLACWGEFLFLLGVSALRKWVPFEALVGRGDVGRVAQRGPLGEHRVSKRRDAVPDPELRSVR